MVQRDSESTSLQGVHVKTLKLLYQTWNEKLAACGFIQVGVNLGEVELAISGRRRVAEQNVMNFAVDFSFSDWLCCQEKGHSKVACCIHPTN
jgi:hypothetical protein